MMLEARVTSAQPQVGCSGRKRDAADWADGCQVGAILRDVFYLKHVCDDCG
jgi:hypothetical protein